MGGGALGHVQAFSAAKADDDVAAVRRDLAFDGRGFLAGAFPAEKVFEISARALGPQTSMGFFAPRLLMRLPISPRTPSPWMYFPGKIADFFMMNLRF